MIPSQKLIERIRRQDHTKSLRIRCPLGRQHSLMSTLALNMGRGTLPAWIPFLYRAIGQDISTYMGIPVRQC